MIIDDSDLCWIIYQLSLINYILYLCLKIKILN